MSYFREKELLKTKLDAAQKDLAAFMILPFGEEIALESSRIEAQLKMRGQMIGLNDIYIAATALRHKAILMTRNTSHFERIDGLTIKNTEFPSFSPNYKKHSKRHDALIKLRGISKSIGEKMP